MSSTAVKKDIEEFQSFVKKLSVKIGKAGALWGDSEFSELSSSIREIANMSKDVIITGERCCSSIDKLDKIATEKY